MWCKQIDRTITTLLWEDIDEMHSVGLCSYQKWCKKALPLNWMFFLYWLHKNRKHKKMRILLLYIIQADNSQQRSLHQALLSIAYQTTDKPFIIFIWPDIINRKSWRNEHIFYWCFKCIKCPPVSQDFINILKMNWSFLHEDILHMQ